MRPRSDNRPAPDRKRTAAMSVGNRRACRLVPKGALPASGRSSQAEGWSADGLRSFDTARESPILRISRFSNCSRNQDGTHQDRRGQRPRRGMDGAIGTDRRMARLMALVVAGRPGGGGEAHAGAGRHRRSVAARLGRHGINGNDRLKQHRQNGEPAKPLPDRPQANRGHRALVARGASNVNGIATQWHLGIFSKPAGKWSRNVPPFPISARMDCSEGRRARNIAGSSGPASRPGQAGERNVGEPGPHRPGQ